MRREPLLRRRLTILDAIDDPNIFAHAFQNAASWSSWRTFLACLFGLPLSEEQRQLFKQCTKRDTSHLRMNAVRLGWSSDDAEARASPSH